MTPPAAPDYLYIHVSFLKYKLYVNMLYILAKQPFFCFTVHMYVLTDGSYRIEKAHDMLKHQSY